jgi:hypothetical protein
MTVTNEERQYAMGVLAAKGAMRDGTAFAIMIEQAEEVLANEPPEAEVARLRRALQELVDALAANDEYGLNEFADVMVRARSALR